MTISIRTSVRLAWRPEAGKACGSFRRPWKNWAISSAFMTSTGISTRRRKAMMMTWPARVRTEVSLPMHVGREDRKLISAPVRHRTTYDGILRGFLARGFILTRPIWMSLPVMREMSVLIPAIRCEEEIPMSIEMPVFAIS